MAILKQESFHYDMATLAKTLKLASVDRIQTPSTEIESHWYRSDGPADLFFWTSGGKLVKHQLSLFGQVIEWNEFDGIKTGYVEDDQPSGKPYSEIVCFDKSPNHHVTKQASEFLKAVESIDAKTRQSIEIHYSSYFRLDVLSSFWLVKLFKKWFRI